MCKDETSLVNDCSQTVSWEGGSGFRRLRTMVLLLRRQCQSPRGCATKNWEEGILTLLTGHSSGAAWALGFGWGSCWGAGLGLSRSGSAWALTDFLSCLQDSDGDKSDDLVVDVSNEVRAGPSCREAPGWGGLGQILCR